MLGLADRGSLQLETRPSGHGSGPLISPTAAKAIAAARAGGTFGGAKAYDEEEDEEEEESSSSSLDLEQVNTCALRVRLVSPHTFSLWHCHFRAHNRCYIPSS